MTKTTHPETLCVQNTDSKKLVDNSGSISFPIYQTATYAHHGLGQSTGFDYSRLHNPTRDEIERIVCRLEQGTDALAYSSGMAAVSAIIDCYQAGDEIIASDDLYGGSIRLFKTLAKKNQIHIRFADTTDLDNVNALFNEKTKAIFIETPTNPMMNVSDIQALAALAKAHHCDLIVDNTFLTPFYQNPLTLGADVVIHSGTKYLSGHNDSLSGFLVTNRADIQEKLRYNVKTVGNMLSPFDSWLVLRGIKTLAIRMERQQENAQKLASWLTTQPQVSHVYYIGLPDHPGYNINRKQSRGFGAMISFSLASFEATKYCLEHVKVIQFAESLGGVESLITYPYTQTHADVDEAERNARGITNQLLRLSVGLEHVDDLIADLDQALNGGHYESL